MVFYETPDGHKVESFSFSQGNSHRFCPAKYMLERGLGYRRKLQSPALDFGNCTEASIRAYHQLGADPRAKFAELWEKIKDEPRDYKDWQTWETLLECGKQLMTLYLLTKDRLGINNPKFHTYAEPMIGKLKNGAKHKYIPDCIDWPAPHVKWGEGPRIIDIKTADSPYRDQPEGIASMDDQLRIYSHETKIERVAFMVFVKSNPAKLGANKSGDLFTLMAEAGGLRQGDLVKIDFGGAKGKALDLMKAQLDAEEMTSVTAVGKKEVFAVKKKILNPCRIQLVEGKVEQYQAEATYEWLSAESDKVAASWQAFLPLRENVLARADGMNAEQYDHEMFLAAVKAFPQRPGMKFPDDRCGWCEMLGVCMKNKALQEEKLVRIQDAFLEEL